MSIEGIVAAHVSDGHRLCYAPTLGPITAKHQFGGHIEAKVLRCTWMLDHTGDHRDAACCYTPHRFGREMAGPPEPDHIRWERCVACKQSWPCDVERIRAAMEGQ